MLSYVGHIDSSQVKHRDAALDVMHLLEDREFPIPEAIGILDLVRVQLALQLSISDRIEEGFRRCGLI